MTPLQEVWLADATGLGKKVQLKYKDQEKRPGKRTIGTVVDEVSIIVDECKHFLQRIEYAQGMQEDHSNYAYRAGYYILSAKGHRIVFGQYNPLLTESNMRALLHKAHQKRWPIFSN
jgi:hypothetical protein